MRRVVLGIGVSLSAVAGCLAPFSWPDDRRAADVLADTSGVESFPQAVGFDPPPMRADMIPTTEPPPARDDLTAAAEKLDRGDDAGALPHLQAHVAAHPDAVMIRAYLAELHLKLGHPADSRAEFERVIATAQFTPAGPARRHLVHCHTRLMEIADADGDPFAEHLHRGIGLFLLVKQWDADPDRRDDAAAEQTLAKAAVALRRARDEKPGDPRTNLYLADVYDRLGQPSAATAARRAAKAGLPDGTLTAWETERLRGPD